MLNSRRKAAVASLAVAVAIQPITSGSLYENRTEYSIGGIFSGNLTLENPEVVWVLSNAFEITILGISSDSSISLNLHIPFGSYSKPTEVVVTNGESSQNIVVESSKELTFTATRGSLIRIETEDFVIPSSVDPGLLDSRTLYLGISNLKIIGAGWKARIQSVLGL